MNQQNKKKRDNLKHDYYHQNYHHIINYHHINMDIHLLLIIVIVLMIQKILSAGMLHHIEVKEPGISMSISLISMNDADITCNAVHHTLLEQNNDTSRLCVVNYYNYTSSNNKTEKKHQILHLNLKGMVVRRLYYYQYYYYENMVMDTMIINQKLIAMKKNMKTMNNLIIAIVIWMKTIMMIMLKISLKNNGSEISNKRHISRSNKSQVNIL